MSEPINRKVIDISHHNTPTDWDAIFDAGVIGVIHKATEGGSYQDDTYVTRCAKALDAGLLWGAYHFANDTDVQEQVDNFLGLVGVDDETLYCLDWEDNNGATMSLDQAREFVERLEEEIGENRTVLYSGNTAKEALGAEADPFWSARRMWLCQYGSTPKCQASWDTYWLWQYSDGSSGPGPHGCPGVSGAVDTNSWAGTDDELRAQWSGVAPTPDPFIRRRPLVVVHGLARVIVNGKLVN